MNDNFHEIRFPTSISFGSSGGPERRTEIVSLASGHEERNSPWAHSRHRYNAGLGARSLDDIHDILGFFEARHGQLYGFRWKDWSDWKSGPPGAAPTAGDQMLGVGDGTVSSFQLKKTYASGLQSYERLISKPVAGSILIAADGVIQTEGPDYVLDSTTGLINFTSPPGAGVQLSSGFVFDVPVRFDTDFLDINLSAFKAGDIPSVPILELRI